MTIRILKFLAILAAILLAYVIVGAEQWAVQAEPVLSVSKSGGIPYWAFLIIICFGWLLGSCFTLLATTLKKTVNRADDNPPLKLGYQVKYTLAAGAIIGLICQFTFQGVISHITGTPVFWEMLIGIPFLTGMGAMALYEVLIWRWKGKRKNLYVRLRVKHIPGYHNTGNPEDEIDLDDTVTQIFMQHDKTMRVKPEHVDFDPSGDDITTRR